MSGAGLQYKASSDAQDRQRREIAASLEAQKQLQMEAEAKAKSAAGEYETPKRVEAQDKIAADIEQSLINPVSESQAIRAQQQTTQGDVSGEYSTAKAASDLETMKQAQQLARLLGKTTSASRLRMNEGIRLMDTGQEIDQLAGFSRGRSGADNIAIQQAGQVDPGQMLLGSLLQTAGTAGLIGGGTGVTASQTAAANATADPIAALNSAKNWTGGAPSFGFGARLALDNRANDWVKAFR